MKICFIPIDNRPVCYNLAKDICAIDDDIELFIPPREYLGNLEKYANTEKIFEWIKNVPKVDAMILSLDTLAYGGLIPSRRITESYEDIKNRMEQLKPLLINTKVYAFSSIMRISNNNYNEEEKDYWAEYGKKIFEYSYNTSKNNIKQKTDIPQFILEDYLNTRKRNFEINKLYLKWQQEENIFDTLIFSKDDCAEFGFNVDEAKILEKMGGTTKTGTDEIPLTLLSRSLKKNINIYTVYTEPNYTNCVSNYEDVSIKKTVEGQLELGGFNIVNTEQEADIILIVNNFIKKQGEHVMGWNTALYNGMFVKPNKPFAVADVRYANGADNNFIEQLFKYSLPEYGYSGWNTSANTIGSLLAGIKVKFQAKKYNDIAFKKLQAIRYLDDWAYQANVRKHISKPCNIKALMKPYENTVFDKIFKNQSSHFNLTYTYPWNRKFEIEVNIQQ